MTTETWRWIAIIVCLLTGAGLVLFGHLEGEQWATLAGGSGVAGARALPAK